MLCIQLTDLNILLFLIVQRKKGLLTFVNCWSVKLSTRVQDLFTYGKLAAIATIIATGAYQLSQGMQNGWKSKIVLMTLNYFKLFFDSGHFEHFTFENTETDFTKIALSFYSALFAYNGW